MRFIHFLTCLHSLIITFIHSLVFFKHCGKLSKTYRIRQSSCLTSHHCDQFVLLAPLLYSFARALVIRYHKLSKLSHKNVLSAGFILLQASLLASASLQRSLSFRRWSPCVSLNRLPSLHGHLYVQISPLYQTLVLLIRLALKICFNLITLCKYLVSEWFHIPRY